MQKNINRYWFTLVEILIWILIVSIVIVFWFQAFSSALYWKIRLIQQTDIQKDSFYFNERLFDMIKEWGTVDYEEYFNRKIVGNTTYSSGHYSLPTGFWNYGFWGTVGTNWAWYGIWFYQCISKDGARYTGTWSCVTDFNYYGGLDNRDYTGPQRYGQYSYQFLDYNSNANWDLWDENWDGNIVWDEDDEHLWVWPDVFATSQELRELYLISGDKKKRTYFRWNVKKDPNSGSIACTMSWGLVITGSWCLGTIEFLRLDALDWWLDHDIAGNDSTQYDWVPDTWVIDPIISWFSGATSILASGPNDLNEEYWIPLFPPSINVVDFKLQIFPNKDREWSWGELNNQLNISPYVRLSYSIEPSWETKRKISGKVQRLYFSTTIQLTDIFSK